jgi:hypothetical protein
MCGARAQAAPIKLACATRLRRQQAGAIISPDRGSAARNVCTRVSAFALGVGHHRRRSARVGRAAFIMGHAPVSQAGVLLPNRRAVLLMPAATSSRASWCA